MCLRNLGPRQLFSVRLHSNGFGITDDGFNLRKHLTSGTERRIGRAIGIVAGDGNFKFISPATTIFPSNCIATSFPRPNPSVSFPLPENVVSRLPGAGCCAAVFSAKIDIVSKRNIPVDEIKLHNYLLIIGSQSLIRQ